MTTADATRPSSQTGTTQPGAELTAAAGQPPTSDTPRRLRGYQLVTAVAVLLLGLIGVGQLTGLRSQLSVAPTVGVQHVRLGELSGTISLAGSQAAADALAGARGDTATASLAKAAGLLVEAAAAEPDQAEAISTINADLLRYGQLLSSAQFDAADEVRTSSLQPAIDTLGEKLSSAAQSPWWTSPWISLGFGAIVLVGLCWMSFQVAQRSHRVLNSGLVAAIVATVAISGLAAGGTPVSDGTGLSSGSVIESSTQLTGAQLQADAATRILQDAARQKRWDKAAQDAFSTADTKAADGFVDETADRYAKLQGTRKAVTVALASGNWGKASTLLGTASEVADAEAALANGITDQRAVLRADAAADTQTDNLLFAFEVGAAVLALGGAFLGSRGLQTRIEEYR